MPWSKKVRARLSKQLDCLSFRAVNFMRETQFANYEVQPDPGARYLLYLLRYVANC